MSIVDVFFDVYDLYGVLNDSRCQMSHRRWIDCESFWPDCHGISRWPIGLTIGKKMQGVS